MTTKKDVEDARADTKAAREATQKAQDALDDMIAEERDAALAQSEVEAAYERENDPAYVDPSAQFSDD